MMPSSCATECTYMRLQRGRGKEFVDIIVGDEALPIAPRLPQFHRLVLNKCNVRHVFMDVAYLEMKEDTLYILTDVPLSA